MKRVNGIREWVNAHPRLMVAASLLAFMGVGTVAFRSAIPFGTANSWSSAVNSDPNAVRGPWFNASELALVHTNTGGSGTDWQLDQVQYSVKVFGAKGDGSTNDTTAIANAVAAVIAAGGGEVFFPVGTYRVTEIDITNAAGVGFRGSNASLVGTSDSNTILNFNNCTNCRVAGMTISHLNHLARGGFGIQVANSTNFVIDGNYFSHTASAAVWITASNHVSVSNNQLDSTFSDGIDTVGGSTDVAVTGNNITNSGDDAIAVLGVQSDATQTARVAVTGNTVYHSATRGITCVGCAQTTISGNTVELTAGAGIYVSQETQTSTRGSTNVTVSGNTIKDATTLAPIINGHGSIMIYSGDSLHPTTNVLVTGNTVYGGGYECIHAGVIAAPSVDQVFVTGNKCLGPTSSGYGIEFDNIATGSIFGNSVSLASTTGILVDATCTTITTSDNIIYYPNQANNASAYGVYNRASAAACGINYVYPDPGKTALLANSKVDVAAQLLTPDDLAANSLATFTVDAYSGTNLKMLGTGNHISLQNVTSNYVSWGTAGIGPPQLLGKSVGEKLVLYNIGDGTNADWAIGMDTNVMWLGLSRNVSTYKLSIKGGTADVFTVDGTGSVAMVAGKTIDTMTAGSLGLCGSTCNALSLGKSGVVTTINGTTALAATAFASLGTPSNGTITYCNDCTVANPCAGSGTGALAKRLNGAWVCN